MYVDDIVVTGSDCIGVDKLVLELNSMFALKDMGSLNYFLGMEVCKLPTGLVLSQKKYISDLLIRVGMQDVRPVSTPMTATTQLSAYYGTPVSDPKLYCSTIGALQYVTLTRPEIAFAVNRVSQYLHEPLDIHWQVVKRILRYLKGTISHGLSITPATNLQLIGFSDADWAANVDDRKSISGYCIMLGTTPISWSAKKQVTVSRSSTEAEYRSLAMTTANILWMQSLFTELKVQLRSPSVLWCDNQSTIAIANNPVLRARTKHIELNLYFVRDKVREGVLSIQYIPTHD